MPRKGRLGELDIADRLSPAVPALITQVAFGLLCTGAAVGTRYLIFLSVGAAGPYALIYPAILISTLFGTWRAGIVTFAASFTHAWFAVLPITNSFQFANADDWPRTIVNGSAAFVVLVFAELFRSAVHRAVKERRHESELRELLLKEVDHRMKGNFQVVANMLEIQQRKASNPAAINALQEAHDRVLSFSAAHLSLFGDTADYTRVNMNEYLGDLVTHLRKAMFSGDKIKLEYTGVDFFLPSDRAIAVGLVLNELITNAANHAFETDASGRIQVSFDAIHDDWILTVTDNGRGMPEDYMTGTLGYTFIPAFAARAGAEVKVERPAEGACIRLIAFSDMAEGEHLEPVSK